MVKISKQKFGDWLRKARTEKGVTLIKFAKMVGKSPTYISKIERGYFDQLPEKTISTIAQKLGQDEDMVLGIASKISDEIGDVFTQEEWDKLISTATVFNRNKYWKATE